MTSITTSMDWRYATKQFDPAQKLSDAAVQTLLADATLSASSYGLQPYEFVIVSNPAIREKLKAAAWNQSQVTDASHLIVIAARIDLDDKFVNTYIETVASTRGIPVTSLDGYKGMMLGFVTGHNAAEKIIWAQKQAYIALGTLLVSAAVHKIDACPMEGFDPKAYDDILGLNAMHLTATLVVPVGHRHADDKSAHYKKVRWPSSRMVHTIN